MLQRLKFTFARPRRPAMCRRVGNTLILVLAVSVISSAIALGALAISSVKRRTVDLERDYVQAGQVVESGVELAMAQAALDPDWRTTFPQWQNGSDRPSVQIGNGESQWHFVDPADGIIENNDSDPVRIVSTATYGKSTRRFSIAAIQQGRPLDVLRASVHAGGNLTVVDTLISGLGPISSNTQIDLTNGEIHGAAEAPVILLAENVAGGVYEGAAQKTMPSRSLFEIYQTMAEEILMSDLVANTLTGAVDASNSPSAETCADGIYKIEVAANTTLTLSNCKIRGTLLIDLSGEQSKLGFGQGVVWQPRRSGLPAMIVYTENDAGTTVDIRCDGQYTDGIETTDASLNGLFHVIRNVPSPTTKTTIVAKQPISGCLVVEGDCDVAGVNHLIANWRLVSLPPLGYTTAVDRTNRISNGLMDEGLRLWTSTSRNPKGYDTQIVPRFVGGSNQILVTDRPSASSGIFQDLTHWIQSGQTISGSVDVRTASADEDVKVSLEWASQTDGIQQLSTIDLASTSGSTQLFSFTPTWTGSLKHARLIITTTVNPQDFYIDNATIADTRLVKPSNLLIVPTSWRIEVQ